MRKKTKAFSIRIPEDYCDVLDQMAAANDSHRSTMISAILTEPKWYREWRTWVKLSGVENDR